VTDAPLPPDIEAVLTDPAGVCLGCVRKLVANLVAERDKARADAEAAEQRRTEAVDRLLDDLSSRRNEFRAVQASAEQGWGEAARLREELATVEKERQEFAQLLEAAFAADPRKRDLSALLAVERAQRRQTEEAWEKDEAERIGLVALVHRLRELAFMGGQDDVSVRRWILQAFAMHDRAVRDAPARGPLVEVITAAIIAHQYPPTEWPDGPPGEGEHDTAREEAEAIVRALTGAQKATGRG